MLAPPAPTPPAITQSTDEHCGVGVGEEVGWSDAEAEGVRVAEGDAEGEGEGEGQSAATKAAISAAASARANRRTLSRSPEK